MKCLAVLPCFALAACIAGPREPVTIEGRLVFADGAPPPPGYVLYLSEWRQPGWLGRHFTIAVITPENDGSFSVEAYVCRNIGLQAPSAAGVGGRRDDPQWGAPIALEADVARTEFVRSRSWPDSRGLEQREADEFAQRAEALGGARRVPC